MIRFLRAAAVAAPALAAVALAIPAASASTGTSASVAASTTFVNRSDSGNHGTWATDTFTRTATVTPDGLVVSPSCGSLGAQCYKFTGSVSDSGTFVTVPGAANSPQAGVAVKAGHGTLAGGWPAFTFYASSSTVASSGVPAHVNGNGGVSTSNWLTQFFQAGTHFVPASPIGGWSWTYKAAGTCEQWVDSAANGDGAKPADGDITGVSQCKPALITAAYKCGTWKHTGYSLWYHPGTGPGSRNVTVWSYIGRTKSYVWDTHVTRTPGQYGRIWARGSGVRLGYWSNGSYHEATFMAPKTSVACG